VTHTVPSTAPSSQYAALALQNTTWPEVSGDPPEDTVAVSVTGDPAVTLAGETASVVVVLLAVAARADVERKKRFTINSAETSTKNEKLRSMFFCGVIL